jgi:type IV fimbrial biogenesis protein FimT
MSSEKGFTLIELMTTLGVATILIAVAIPSMQSFRMNSRQSASINDLLNGMRVARNTAITTNSRVTVCASERGTACENVGWDKGWIAFVDRDQDRALDAGETVIRAGAEVVGVTIRSGQFGNFLVYRPNGRVMSASVDQNNGQLTFCDERGSEHAKGIRLDLSGRPRVYDSESGGLSPSC